MLSPTYEITTALSHTDELISPPYDIAIVTISYGRVIMSSVWDSMMSKKNVGWPFYAAVQTPWYFASHGFILSRRWTLQWRHNGLDGVSNHQPHHCLLSRLFGRGPKKTSKLPVTGHCAGNSPGTGDSPHKWPVTRKMFPSDDVVMTQCDSYLQLDICRRHDYATLVVYLISATKQRIMGEYLRTQ